MSEMIEKVARAMCLSRKPNHPSLNDDDRWWKTHGSREAYLGLARAAIEAMREPTEAMLAAGRRNNHPRDEETWRTMIDAALA